MKKKWQKVLAGLLAGAFITSGAGLVWEYAPLAVSAKAKQETRRPQPKKWNGGRDHDRYDRMGGSHYPGHPALGHAPRRGPGPREERLSPNEMSEKLGQTFKLDAKEILAAYNDGADFRDIIHGAFVAKAAKRSFADIIKLKTRDNYWRDVEESQNVTPEMIRAIRDELLVEKLAQKLALEQSIVKELVADGYHPHDIAFAAAIAKLAPTDIKAVLGEKRINNSWRDVALMHKISDRDLHQAMREIGGPSLGFMHFGRRGGPGPHHGGFMPPPPPPDAPLPPR